MLATVSTLLVVAIGILINNHRLGDMKDRLKIAELDNRITRLER